MKGFAGDYFEARARFVSAAERAGLLTETFWHPSARAPSGARLAVDLAWAGKRDASHVLFTVCGTHGVEGYPGSAAQCALLESSLLEALPEHVAVLFLHGLNPFGWSRDIYVNEDNVNINRNFIDFARTPVGDDELVRRLMNVVDVPRMSFATLGEVMERLFAIRDEVGEAQFVEAFLGGQYAEAHGPEYGGNKPCWSSLLYRDVARHYLSNAKFIAEVDWHTGLGDYGDLFPICFAPAQSEELAVTSQWWGAEAVARGRKIYASDDAPPSQLSGLVHVGLMQEAHGARIAGGVVEFGTVPVPDMLLCSVLNHWLAHNSGEQSAPFWRAQMRTLMAPRESCWEISVSRRAAQLYMNTLEGLAQWQ